MERKKTESPSKQKQFSVALRGLLLSPVLFLVSQLHKPSLGDLYYPYCLWLNLPSVHTSCLMNMTLCRGETVTMEKAMQKLRAHQVTLQRNNNKTILQPRGLFGSHSMWAVANELPLGAGLTVSIQG